jgi:hypothetical protein
MILVSEDLSNHSSTMYSIASFDKFSQRRPLVHIEGYSSKTTFLEHMVDK